MDSGVYIRARTYLYIDDIQYTVIWYFTTGDFTIYSRNVGLALPAIKINNKDYNINPSNVLDKVKMLLIFND